VASASLPLLSLLDDVDEQDDEEESLMLRQFWNAA